MVAGLPAEAIELIISGDTNLTHWYMEHYGIVDFEANPHTDCEDGYHSICYESALPEVDLDDVIIMLYELVKEKSDDV